MAEDDIALLVEEINSIPILCDTHTDTESCDQVAEYYLVGPCDHPGTVCREHLALFQLVVTMSDGADMECKACGNSFSSLNVSWSLIND